MYRRGNARLLTFLYVSLRGRGLREASGAKRLTSVLFFFCFFCLGAFIGWRLSYARPGAAYETVKAGQRLLSDGRHASLSSSFSEIEFGRARPTSLLHSTIHLLIPSGEGRGRGNEVREWEGRKEGGRETEMRWKRGMKCKRRDGEKRGKWLETKKKSEKRRRWPLKDCI